MSLLRRFRDTFRPRRLNGQIEDEFQFHLEQRVEDLIAQGVSADEAHKEAQRMFGNLTYLRESARDRDVLVWLESILQDLRFALRNLRHSPTFTAVALLSLAFGIGVNAAIFTLVDGVLLEKLPVPDPERIVQVRGYYPQFHNDSFNIPIFREFARQRGIFADLIGFFSSPVSLELDGRTENASLQFVTGGYFQFFNARPALGRLLSEDDDRVEGAHPVCVLGFAAWQRLFGGAPAVLRRTVRIRGTTLRIVGIAPPGFVGAELQRQYDLFSPTAETNDLAGIPRESSNNFYLRILGRIQSSLSRPEASERLAAASTAIESALPSDRGNKDGVYRLLDASKGYDNWRTSLHDPLVVLMGAVSMVLLVACANLANLLLARASARRQEFAIKLAIGIGRGRLMRQLLVETMLLAVAGGGLALLLSTMLVRFLLATFNAGNQWTVLNVSPNSAVLIFTFGACLITVLLAGLYPAWHASRTDAGPGLKASASVGRRAFVRRALILVQVTLAVVLLFGASLFAHSLRNLKTIDLGYRIDHILDVQIGLNSTLKGGNSGISPPEMREILDRARHLPGVETAALNVPGVLSGNMFEGDITSADAGGGSRKVPEVHFIEASPGFFATLRIPLLHGRDFSRGDGPNAPAVALVNQRLAALEWPGQDPVGRHFDGWNAKNIEVIGVTANSRDWSVRDQAAPTVYLAFDQQRTMGGTLDLRCAAPMPAIESAVRGIVKSVAPGYQVFSASSLELLRDNQIHQERLLAFLSSLFGALGTSLALVGIYGLIAYAVKRRTREVGIRVSVGAQRPDILWLFLRESAMLLAGGLALGLPIALMLGRLVGKLLYQVPGTDSIGIAVTVVLVAVGGLAASLAPARGAVRVSPVEALREE